MHIRVINPVITTSWEQETLEAYRSAAGPGTEVSVVTLDWGTPSVEGHVAETLVAPDIIAKTIEAERAGVDAVVVDCMGDPGVQACREAVDIPVVGPAEACMHLAAILGHRFSVLTVVDSLIPVVENQALRYGVAPKLASVRAFNIPVLDLASDADATFGAVMAVAEAAVREDGAHVLIPSCTGLAGFAPRIQAELARRGLEVPVLDPPPVAMKLAESLVSLGHAHSRRTYGRPFVAGHRWPVPLPFGS
jgi:allantoin racemase